MRRSVLLAGCLFAAAAVVARGVTVGSQVGRILFWSDRAHPALWSMRPDGGSRTGATLTRRPPGRPMGRRFSSRAIAPAAGRCSSWTRTARTSESLSGRVRRRSNKLALGHVLPL